MLVKHRRGSWITALLAVASLGAAPADGRLIEAVKRGDHPAVRALLQRRADPNVPEPDGTTALHWAARRDDVQTAQLLIRSGANAKAANAFGVTPLFLACTNGSAAMVELLLEAGADPNSAVGEGETALMTAARTGSVGAVKALLAHRANVNATFPGGQTALMWAAAEGHAPVVQLLIDAGADVRARTANDRVATSRRTPVGGFTPLLFAVRAGHIGAVRTLLEKGVDIHDTLADGTGVVVLATANAHYELALFVVDRGADPNARKNGWTALHTLTWVRRPPFGFNPPGPVTTGGVDSLTFVREMVKRGADVNARITDEPRNRYRNALNRIGATPLLLAAKAADAPLMRVLLDVGADPKATTDDKSNLLMIASGLGIASPGEDGGTEQEALECARIAIELGFDVNAVNNDNESALHGAAYRGAPSIVQLLVDRGASTFLLKNQAGWTPLRIAAGVFRVGTYKESLPTAALLRQVMEARGLPTTLEETDSRGSARK
jgi:ankyrin repeat protein